MFHVLAPLCPLPHMPLRPGGVHDRLQLAFGLGGPGDGLGGRIHLVVIAGVREACEFAQIIVEPGRFLGQMHETLFHRRGLRP